MSIPILMYHQIDLPAARGTQFRSLTVHPASFRRQMRWMHRLGYQGLSMRDLMPYLRGEQTGRVFGITFDDGFRNVFEHALPVLSEAGFTATNYFVANQLGGSNVWDVAKGMPVSALMSLPQMRQWALAGQEVGSHGMDHLHLSRLTPEHARHQMTDSRQTLAQLVDQDVTAYCYPYGDFKPEHVRMAQDAGYTNATTTERGLARAEDDFYQLHRVGIWNRTHLLRFFQKCLTQHEERRRG